MSLPGTIAPEIYTFWRQNRPGILALLFINRQGIFSLATNLLIKS